MGPIGGLLKIWWNCLTCYMQHFPRGGRRRPEKGVLLKCELSMGAPAGNNQAQYPEVAADST